MDEQRAAMNASFEELPEWLRDPFAPIRDVVSLALDRHEIDLAVEVIAAIHAPPGFSADQRAIFDQVKAGMLSAVASLHDNDPLRTPEALEMIRISQERRREGTN